MHGRNHRGGASRGSRFCYRGALQRTGFYMTRREPLLGSLDVAIALAVMATPWRLTDAQGKIAVGANVHVSRARAERIHDEVLIAADPENAARLLACAIVGPGPAGERNTAAYATFDGGSTWDPVVTDSRDDAGDPACTFGPRGRAYFTSISQPNGLR